MGYMRCIVYLTIEHSQRRTRLRNACSARQSGAREHIPFCYHRGFVALLGILRARSLMVGWWFRGGRSASSREESDLPQLAELREPNPPMPCATNAADVQMDVRKQLHQMNVRSQLHLKW